MIRQMPAGHNDTGDVLCCIQKETGASKNDKARLGWNLAVFIFIFKENEYKYCLRLRWDRRQTRCCGKGGNAAHRVEKDGRKLPGWGQWDLAPQGRKQFGQDA